AGPFNGFAPLLGEEERASFAASDELRERKRKSLDVMLAFLGMIRSAEAAEPLPSLNMRAHSVRAVLLAIDNHRHVDETAPVQVHRYLSGSLPFMSTERVP
ncbi:hypothetical protein BIS06_00485, partial [Halomonas sp. BBD48]|nr:hypothetical protein [Halomonas sp. BBD48]